MKENATIFDYVRMCKNAKTCDDCPLELNNNGVDMACSCLMREIPDKANEIILNWCKEHPVETRQDRFLKMFPNAALLDKIIRICPHEIDIENNIYCGGRSCDTCRKNYWLAEMKENE